MRKYIFLLFGSLVLSAQNQQIDAAQVENLLSDLTWYSSQYISPASESIIYQAASAWMISPKKKKDWEFTLGLHTNFFASPQKNRSFNVQNSQFGFFQLEDVNDNRLVSVPSVLGPKSETYLTGDLTVFDTQQTVSLRMDGVNQEVIIYPYFQGALALPYGFELLGKFSLRNKLKRGEYQVYGVGLQYNISQHFKNWNNFNLATQIIYNNEFISVDFVQSYKSEIDVGLKSFNTTAHGFQWAMSASKEFGKFEIITGLLWNQSYLNHYFQGQEADILGLNINLIEVFNDRLDTFSKRQNLWIGETSGRYQFAEKWFLQTTVSYGRLFNSNLGVQYQF